MENIFRSLREAYVHFRLSFYTFDALWKMVFNRNVKGVRSFINYLQKHDPNKLREILAGYDTHGLTLLSSALVSIDRTDHYKIAFLILEAGAQPHARHNIGSLLGRVTMHEAIEYQRFHVVRLLIWYDPYNYLDIINPRSRLSIREMLAKWDRTESWSISEAAKITEEAAKLRFKYLDLIKILIVRKDYKTAIECYQRLNDLCQANSESEKISYYPSHREENHRASFVEFYHQSGLNYLKSAYQLCLEWLAQFKEAAALNQNQLADYKEALNCAIQLCQSLNLTRAQQQYQHVLTELNISSRSPAMINVESIPTPAVATSPTAYTPLQGEEENPLPYVSL